MTQVLTWNQVRHLDVRTEGDRVRRASDALTALLTGPCLENESSLLAAMTARLVVRLHASPATVLLKQVTRRLFRLRHEVCLHQRIPPATALIVA